MQQLFAKKERWDLSWRMGEGAGFLFIFRDFSMCRYCDVASKNLGLSEGERPGILGPEEIKKERKKRR